jgi:hypothetical protein
MTYGGNADVVFTDTARLNARYGLSAFVTVLW